MSRCLFGLIPIFLSAAAPADPKPVVPKAIPITYNDRLRPKRLSAEQFDDIIARAEGVCPEGQAVWFLHVVRNREYRDYQDLCVVAYFTPEFRAARLRKGKAAGIVLKIPIVKGKVKAFRTPTTRSIQMAPFALGDYWQVSLPNKPFDGEFDCPTTQLLPFTAPKGFEDKEIIDLVDLVRGNPKPERAEAKPEEIRIQIPERIDGKRPILEFDRLPDGVIEVRTGTQEGPLSGSGEMVRLKKLKDGYKVISIGQWVS